MELLYPTANIISKKVHKIKSYIVKKLCRFAYNLLIFFLTVNKSMGYNESRKENEACNMRNIFGGLL